MEANVMDEDPLQKPKKDQPQGQATKRHENAFVTTQQLGIGNW